MVQFRLIIIVAIIGVIQVCTANPISSEEECDVAKMFSADELQRAKDVELPVGRLVEGKSYGLTFEQMIKFHHLRKTNLHVKENVIFEDMYKACEILNPEQKMASYTSAQEAHLSKIMDTTSHLADKHELFVFIRATVCDYISRPDVFDLEANSFGLPLAPYMEIRFMTMKAEKSSGAERVKVAKQMCCLHEHRNEIVILEESTFTGLPDEELNKFGEHWNNYEAASTLKSFENICDFINTTDMTNDECFTAVKSDDPVHV